MKASALIARLQSVPGDLEVEIEPCTPECLGGGPIRSLWIEDGDDGEPVAVLSRVNPGADGGVPIGSNIQGA